MDGINRGIDFIHRPFQFAITRLISMLLALGLSGLLLINPHHIADSAAQLDHGYLSLIMLSLSAAFIHGIGFNPIFWIWKIVFSPFISWSVLFTFIALNFI